MEINNKNNLITNKLNKGLYSISQSLPYEERKAFLQKYKPSHSFLTCGSIHSIMDQTTKEKVVLHKGVCGNKFCTSCTTLEMGIQLRNMLELLRKKQNDFLYYPSTWTAPNISYDKLGDELAKFSEIITNIKRRKDFKRFFDNHIFKFELTENKSNKKFNLHIHALFATDAIYLNSTYGKKNEIQHILNKIEQQWRFETGGYICVDDTYRGSNWDSAKTLEQVEDWIYYLYKPYWISAGKTRHTKKTRQHIKTAEEYKNDLLQVSNVALAYAKIHTHNKRLLIKSGIFSEAKHSRSKKNSNLTTYDIVMLDDQHCFSLSCDSVYSEVHAERLNEKLEQKRDKYREKYSVKSEQNVEFSLSKIKEEKEKKLSTELFKKVFKKRDLLKESDTLKEQKYFDEVVISEGDRMSSLIEVELSYSCSMIKLKTKRGIRKTYRKSVLRKTFTPIVY